MLPSSPIEDSKITGKPPAPERYHEAMKKEISK